MFNALLLSPPILYLELANNALLIVNHVPTHSPIVLIAILVFIGIGKITRVFQTTYLVGINKSIIEPGYYVMKVAQAVQGLLPQIAQLAHNRLCFFLCLVIIHAILLVQMDSMVIQRILSANLAINGVPNVLARIIHNALLANLIII